MLIGDGAGFREECDGEAVEFFALACMQRTEHRSLGFRKFVDRFDYRSTTFGGQVDAICATIFDRAFAFRKTRRFKTVDQFNGRRSIDCELRPDCILPLRSVR